HRQRRSRMAGRGGSMPMVRPGDRRPESAPGPQFDSDPDDRSSSMNAETLNISVGARLWYGGSAWTVVEHDGTTVVLRSTDRLMRAHAGSLLGLAQPLEAASHHEDSPSELDAVILANLTPAQRKDIETQAKVFQEWILATSDMPLQDRYQHAGA